MKQVRRWAKKHLPYPLKVALAPYIPVLNKSLFFDPRRYPSNNYKRMCVDPQGLDYQRQVNERLRQGGHSSLEATPTIDEIKTVLRAHVPASVLEVGCRSGKILIELSGEFNIEGCDISSDMLRSCPSKLRVFEYDITQPTDAFERDNLYRWHTIFMCGVMQNLMETPLQTAYAMNNMLMLARNKIIIWDWPEVCQWMKQFSDSPKFEYHPSDLGAKR